MSVKSRLKLAAILFVILLFGVVYLQLRPRQTKDEQSVRSGGLSSNGVTAASLRPPSKGASGPPVTLLRVKSPEAIAEAFRKGELPPPLAQAPGGDPDTIAASLAAQVLAMDASSMPSLLTALRLSGISVRSHSNAIVVKGQQPGQGMAINDWQIAAMAKMFGDGLHTKLTDIAADLTGTIPELKGVPLAQLVVQDFAKDADSENVPLHFWAHFIAELGRQSSAPYDLLDPHCDPASVVLDPIQHLLILERFASDLLAKVQKETSPHATLRQQRNAPEATHPTSAAAISAPQFEDALRAILRGSRPPALVATLMPGRAAEYMIADFLQAANSSPCTLTDLQSNVLDANALIMSQGFEALTTFIEDHAAEIAAATGGPVTLAGKLAKFSGIANVIMAYASFVATYAAMDTKITMNNPPLIRDTRNSIPSQQRQLVGTVTLDMGKWTQMINCLRPVLNALGLDVSVNQNGGLSGADLRWHGLDGFPEPVEFFNTGPSIQAAGSYAGAQSASAGAVAVDNFVSSTTNENGEGTVTITGAPRRNFLTKAYPVDKQATVDFWVLVKAVNFKQDMKDLVGGTAGGLQGLAGGSVGLLGILGTLPIELLYRSAWYSSNPYVVPVIDLEPCNEGWYGTVKRVQTNTAQSSSSTVLPGGDTESHSNSLNRTQSDIVKFSGSMFKGHSGEMGNYPVGTWSGDVNGTFLSTDYKTTKFVKMAFQNFWTKIGMKFVCSAPLHIATKDYETITGKAENDAVMFLQPLSDRQIQVVIAPGAAPAQPFTITRAGTVHTRATKVTDENVCSTQTADQLQQVSPRQQEYQMPEIQFVADVNPDDPSSYASEELEPGHSFKVPKVLKGKKSETQDLGAGEKQTVALTWDLHRCE